MIRVLFLLIFLLPGCQDLDKDKKNIPIKEELITRKANTYLHRHPKPKKKNLPTYPWEKKRPPPITKDFFRCKGQLLNPPLLIEENGESKKVYDCKGSKGHSLPVKNGKEFIYPILIKLLNWIQDVTKKQVIITSGHRCPKHNSYVDPSNIYSKHMIGAEVSFYIEDVEPYALIKIIQDYYLGTPYAQFKRYEGKTNVSTKPWFNKEIFIKLFNSNEGRNQENNHAFSYLSIQVRYDFEKEEEVAYTWAKANKGYFER